MIEKFTPEELEELRIFDAGVDNEEITYDDYCYADFIENEILFPKDEKQKKQAVWHKQWYERNKEKCAADNKQYREKNKEKVAAFRKKWRENNKEKCVAYDKQYREKRKKQLAQQAAPTTTKEKCQ